MSEKKNNKSGRFQIIAKYLKQYKLYIWIGGIAIILSNGLALINPYLLKVAFDRLENMAPSNEILYIALAILGLSILSGLFRFIMRRTIIWMSRKIEFKIRGELFRHILNLNPTFYHNHKTGDIMARMTNDVEALRMMAGPGIMHMANALVSSLIALGFMYYMSPSLTLYTLLPLPVIAIIVNRFGQLVHKRFALVQEYFSVLTSRVQENLSGVRVIRAYNQEDYETEDFANHNKEYIRLNMSMIKIQAMLFPILFMLGGAINISVLYFGGQAVINETISLGTLVAFFAYLTMLIWPMIAMGWVVALYQRGTASLDRINEYLNIQSDIVTASNPVSGISLDGKIEFSNLNFGYNGKNILHDLNLTIEPGMTVGIVGPTASGKTTLISLICRLFPVEKGQLLIDGRDINEYDLTTLRSQIGLVPQEPFLFSDTIAENILFSTDDPQPELAAVSARKAIIEKEINDFPDQYETILGERGITLSGGQKQRISIARALAIDPKILILDDVTSAVDTETEHLINQSLNNELNQRTSIIISHRISAVNDAHKNIYLKDGRIIEEGTHEELLKAGGNYDNLYHTQLLEDELENM